MSCTSKGGHVSAEVAALLFALKKIQAFWGEDGEDDVA